MDKNVSDIRKKKGGVIAAVAAVVALVLLGVGAAFAAGGGNIVDGIRNGMGGVASLLGGGSGDGQTRGASQVDITGTTAYAVYDPTTHTMTFIRSYDDSVSTLWHTGYDLPASAFYGNNDPDLQTAQAVSSYVVAGPGTIADMEGNTHEGYIWPLEEWTQSETAQTPNGPITYRYAPFAQSGQNLRYADPSNPPTSWNDNNRLHMPFVERIVSYVDQPMDYASATDYQGRTYGQNGVDDLSTTLLTNAFSPEVVEGTYNGDSGIQNNNGATSAPDLVYADYAGFTVQYGAMDNIYRLRNVLHDDPSPLEYLRMPASSASSGQGAVNLGGFGIESHQGSEADPDKLGSLETLDLRNVVNDGTWTSSGAHATGFNLPSLSIIKFSETDPLFDDPNLNIMAGPLVAPGGTWYHIEDVDGNPIDPTDSNYLQAASWDDIAEWLSSTGVSADCAGTWTRPGSTSTTITKVWDDNNDAQGLRPSSVDITIQGSSEYTEMETQYEEVYEPWDGSNVSVNELYVLAADGSYARYSQFIQEYEFQFGTKPGGFDPLDPNSWADWRMMWDQADPWDPAMWPDPDAPAGSWYFDPSDPGFDSFLGVLDMWSEDPNSPLDIFEMPRLYVCHAGFVEVPVGQTIQYDLDPISITLTAADGWSQTVDLPDENGRGNSINYTFAEDNVPNGYTSSVAGSTITNRLEQSTPPVSQTVSFSVGKVWQDNNDEFGNRPNSVVVEVYADGDTSNPVDTATLTAPNWSASFTLPADDNGAPITYTVDEQSVPGYNKLISGDATNGFTITNYTAYADMHITKVWDDNMDAAGERPETLTLYILNERPWHSWVRYGNSSEAAGWLQSITSEEVQDFSHSNAVVATLRIDGTSEALPAGMYPSDTGGVDNNMWFVNGPALPAYRNGSPMHYYLLEERVPGYKTPDESRTIGEGGYGITNTYQAPPQTSQLTVNRVDEQDANAASTTLEVVEEMPSGISVEAFVPTDYNLTIDQGAITPTVNVDENTLTYSVPVANTKTFRMNTVRGGSITISNQTTSVPLTKTEGDGTQAAEGEDITLSVSSSDMELTVAARGSGSSQGGDQPGDDPNDPNTGGDPSDPNQGGSSTNNPTGRTQGWLRVNSVLNTEATYDAFKVFDAAVVQDGNDYKGSHFLWESNAVQSAVMTYISSIDSNNDGNTDYEEWLATKYGKNVSQVSNDDKNNPQNAAEWIAIKIADSEEDTTANTTPKTTKGDTFATELAAALRNAGIQPTAVIDENQITPLDQGYYLVATTQSTIDDGEAGTAPIWAPVPSGGYTVDEKVSVPTFNKQVKDNTTDTTNWNKVADGSTGQWLDFKLTATLPDNIEAFPTYPLSIEDVIPAGMDATIATDNGFSVSLAGTDITEHAEAGLANNVLTVSVADVLDETTLGVGVQGGDTLVILYRAKLNSNSVKGSAGNDNEATLTYPADPLVPTTTGELESSARVLTYQIQVDKVDEATRLPLDNAVFKVKTNIGGTDYWVKSDGSLVATEGQGDEFATVNGAFTISGIDEGTYTIYETQAPTLYEALTSPLTVVLTATKNYAGGTLTSLAATASGANGTLVSNPSATQDGVVGTVLATGTAEVRISDVKQIVLPLTGMPVKTAGIVAGIAIAVVSAVAYVVGKRRNKEEDEQ